MVNQAEVDSRPATWTAYCYEFQIADTIYAY